MRVLIVGRGVVGTIYGWALSKAGIDVTHVVRKQGLPATDNLDLLDLRRGYPKHAQVTYAPQTVGQISRSDGFDLVIVATKHYQAVPAVQQYLPDVPGATILLFTANWDGTEDLDRILARSSALWGYAKATGGVDAPGRPGGNRGSRSPPWNVEGFRPGPVPSRCGNVPGGGVHPGRET